MTLDVGVDTALVNRVVGRHIKTVPIYQQEFVLSCVEQICKGTKSYDGGLNEIGRRYGQRIRNTAKQILDGILLEAAVPRDTLMTVVLEAFDTVESAQALKAKTGAKHGR